ncbi:MAG TPA: glycoside hydrolase family 9 protein [Verrucomicrobiae bacterium]|nr:glycoside hydrolase family 9 protein [Verrucomicrobiae bacterium]
MPKINLALALACLSSIVALASETIPVDESSLVPPAVGFNQLRILTPTVLELTLITTKSSNARPAQWNFVSGNGQLSLPPTNDFVVTVAGQRVSISAIGFKRRVRYAPLSKRDLRIGNYLYLQLSRPINGNQVIEVTNPNSKLWDRRMIFKATADPHRYSPVIHANQVAYTVNFPKLAMVGYFLGSLGELDTSTATNFHLMDAKTSAVVFTGDLKPRRDVGFNESPPPYQRVVEADFTSFNTPGEYHLLVPGYGTSYPFFIDEGGAAAIARTYALGLYHQRCGTSNSLPFTRFVHGACHVAPAHVPTERFTDAAQFISRASEDFAKNPRHVAPRLKDFRTSLYPFVRQGRIDVSGGHHDAGDYSKYTINSAGLIHTLVFAADVLPGVGGLDNLGLPESGDGKSDLLQEAKWEADFLAKMQDDDGGFYFLVYPRNREYENDVLPDRGDSQIVWPKNTAATAAAVAALAQASSSPLFKRQFPEAAALYLTKAQKGWGFLERAIAKYGRDGSYQKLTHYGDDFMHDDEIAWAACELFLATGTNTFHQQLLKSFNPGDDTTRRWGWWRLYESYGRAIRSYAFAAKTGRIPRDKLDDTFLRACETELLAAADDQLQWAQQSAYGTSFPAETKKFRGGGWYFSMDQAFDLAAGSALDQPAQNDPRPRYLAAMLSNLNYEAGCNPVNICYLTGLGWQRQDEIVHHYAMNDRRLLPPDGIPIGNIQSAFMWLENYQDELKALSFPPDDVGDRPERPYPIYDRWSDSFNVQTEFVAVNQARALATAAFLMAQTKIKNQPWRASSGKIEVRPTTTNAPVRYRATLKTDLPALESARIIWEVEGQPPKFGPSFELPRTQRGPLSLEVEAQFPDGRRVFGATNLNAAMMAR